jgi:hypothetical protein
MANVNNVRAWRWRGDWMGNDMKPKVYLETTIPSLLLTWNCRHIANAAISERIRLACRNAGYEPPVICTPHGLMAQSPYEDRHS